MFLFFFFNDTATTEIYTLSLHDALPILQNRRRRDPGDGRETRRRDAGVPGHEPASAHASPRDPHASCGHAQRHEGRGVAREAARFRARPGARGRDRGSWVSRGGEHEPRRRTDGVPFAPPPARRPPDDVAAGEASTPVDREGLPPAIGWAKFLCPSQLPRG